MDATKALEEYLIKAMNDKRSSPLRRDRAACLLAKHLQGERKTKRGDQPMVPRENNAGYRSKKAERTEAALETAQSESWTDLIPKAKVVQLRKC
jgi:hypothetical protein